MMQRLPLASCVRDPAVAVGVGDGQGLQADLQADHLDKAAAEHVRGIAAGAAVLGHGHAGPAVAIGNVMAGAARVGVRAVHHLGGAVGQHDALDLADIAVDAVALAEVALGEVLAPEIAEPGIDLLEVHRAARLPGIGGVDDADARRLDRQAAQVARHLDGVVERVAGPFALLSVEEELATERQAGEHAEEEAARDPYDFAAHRKLPRIGAVRL